MSLGATNAPAKCRCFFVFEETAGQASMTYLSTLAVLQLDAILTNAVLVETTPANPKKKNQKGFKSMLRMSYNCPGIGLVKMMVGVKQSDKTKVQYCITAIDTHGDCVRGSPR